MKNIFVKIGVVIVMVVLFSIGIDALYRRVNSLEYPWPRNILTYPESDEKYEFVVLGNSHTEEGIGFDGYNVKALRLAGVAQSFEYDLAYLKMHAKQIKPGALVVISASPISFSQGRPGRPDIYQRIHYGRLSPFLIPRLEVGEYLESQLFPFFRAGHQWRAHVNGQIQETVEAKEKKRLELAGPSPTPTSIPTSTPTPAPTTNQLVPMSAPQLTPKEIPPTTYFLSVKAIENELDHPQTVPSTKLVDSMHFVFSKWYDPKGFSTNNFDANRKDLERLIQYIKQNNWRPVIITLPTSHILQEGLLDDYYQVYLYNNMEKANLLGAEYIDFTHQEKLITNAYLFGDADHLNNQGRLVFSYLLLRSLIDKGYLSEEADGYNYIYQPSFPEIEDAAEEK